MAPALFEYPELLMDFFELVDRTSWIALFLGLLGIKVRFFSTGRQNALTLHKDSGKFPSMAEYSKRLADIEGALNRVFPRQTSSSWVQILAAQESLNLRTETLDRINEPGWSLLERGGKRWRPLVMVLVHESFGGTFDRIAELSTLVELPHNGSLIIDDIEDRAEERRGGPAIHLLHGVDMAVNTGNFLYFAPTYLLEDPGLSAEVQSQMTKRFLRVMRRLHLGQGLDIVWHNDHEFLPQQAEYLQMCRYKTGALSRLAAELGAASAGAPESSIDRVGALWEDIGVGFQILDDVKNLVTGNPGKMRGDDIVEGKKSLPVLLHCQNSADGGKTLMKVFQEVRTIGRPVPEVQPHLERAISLMQDSGALIDAQAVAEDLLKKARDQLLVAGQHKAASQMLAHLVDSFWEGLKS